MDNNDKAKSKKIILSGGGTGGPVTPLLAIASELLKERTDLDFVFIDTEKGPARELVSNFKEKPIKFLTIPNGKWRRYFSFHNFFDIFKIIAAFFKSLIILSREKPDLIISAGGFVSVPLVWASAFKKIPILVHQQDLRAGLANRLMAPFARVITVTFEKSLSDYGPKAVLTGNPLKDISVYETNALAARNKYGLEIGRPLVLATGGGTGSLALNDLIYDSLPRVLAECQLVHLTGRGKKNRIENKSESYHSFEFLDQSEVLGLIAAADLVISRAGMGILTELSALHKPAILIPIPNSQQEDNAAFFAAREAAVVFNQKELTAEKLALEVKTILSDARLRGSLSHNISKMMKLSAAANIAAIIWEIIN